jgi:hypothetical protein
MTTPRGVYPFATQDGQAIPLDIIAPRSLMYQNFVSTGNGTAIVIPTASEVGTVFSTKDAILRFTDDLSILAADAEIPNALFIPANTIVTVALTPGTAYVLGIAEAGRLYLQVIDKWAGLGLPTQYVRK